MQRALNLCAAVAGPHHFQAFVLAREGIHEFHVGRRVVVRASRHFLVQAFHLGFQFLNMPEGLFSLGYQRRVVRKHHHLRQIAHADIALHRHASARWPLLAGNDFEHGRFSRTVLSREGNAVAAIDHKTSVREERTR